MRSEAEIRRAILLFEETLATVGLEPHSVRHLKVGIGVLRYVLGEECAYYSVERSLRECAELLVPVEA